MKVLCFGYRSWALNIYDNLGNACKHDITIIRSKKDYSEAQIEEIKPDLILFYGWSWIIPLEIITKYICLMLHPSPLPKYRGGSPIQNQIIRGKNNSALTLFIINDQIDEGEIVGQQDLSLKGTIADIFDRMEKIGIELTLKYLKGDYNIVKQNENEATYYKRRKEEESELTIDELVNKDAEYIYNKIRMLADPYPNAFIKTKDNKRILINAVKISD